MTEVISNMRVSLHCDECGYDEIRPILKKEDIDTKCPKCDAVWFTDEDFVQYEEMNRLFSAMNKLAVTLKAAGLIKASPDDGAKTIRVTKDDLQPGETYADAALRIIMDNAAKFSKKSTH